MKEQSGALLSEHLVGHWLVSRPEAVLPFWLVQIAGGNESKLAAGKNLLSILERDFAVGSGDLSLADHGVKSEAVRDFLHHFEALSDGTSVHFARKCGGTLGFVVKRISFTGY